MKSHELKIKQGGDLVPAIVHNKMRLWHQFTPRNKLASVKYNIFTQKDLKCRKGVAHTKGPKTSLKSKQRFESF